MGPSSAIVRRGRLAVEPVSNPHSCSLGRFGSSAAETDCTTRDDVKIGANAASLPDCGGRKVMMNTALY